ncbi:MAG: MBOAT family protein, partial [Lachnospiraceae bacterium]|nr:MBOAT family protein [Lachnospiraceae bacterium]
IAGPIVRFETVRENLRERKISLEGFESGILRFCLGLAKKVLIADRLFAFCTSAGSVSEGGMLLSWAEGLAYLLYVYYDFSGYSDMAIGLAGCFGFNLPENFNYPLISGSFREFWRRWHISLGTWFRDYLYFPLGGSRAGKAKHIRNLLVVWTLTGLWHGTSLNFVLWGLGFGILLVCEAVFEKKEKDHGLFIKAFKHVMVMTFTVILFVFFRNTDVNDAIKQLGYMFGNGVMINKESLYLLRGGLLLLIFSFIGATPVIKNLAGKLIKKASNSIWEPLLKGSVIIILLTFTTAYLVDGSFSPFLYFRF